MDIAMNDAAPEPLRDANETIALLNAILESVQNTVIFALDANYCYLAFNSAHRQTMQHIWGCDISIGMNMLDIIKLPDDRAKAQDNFDRVLQGEQLTRIEEYGEPPNRFYYENTYSPIRIRDQTVIGIAVFLSDVTARMQLEQTLRTQQEQLEVLVAQRTAELEAANAHLQSEIAERERLEQDRLLMQQKVIDAQQAALQELSTPLIPLARDVVVMPLIGTIDSHRAQRVIDTLLEGVMNNHASIAILDITGVQVVDTQVANALVRAAQAVQLLGSQMILTGIRPEVAQTLVALGVNLGNVLTYSTLQSGISYALGGRPA